MRGARHRWHGQLGQTRGHRATKRVLTVVVLAALGSIALVACEDETSTERSAVTGESEGTPEPESAEPDEAEAETEADPCVEATFAAAKQLGKTLKTRLVGAMGEGLDAAVRVCADEAQAIHARVAEETGVRVGRTSTKVRNPANAEAPEWVRAYLEAHGSEGAHAPGIRGREGNQAHALIPLGAGGLCQTCHGSAIPDDVSAVLAERYPDDQATGFAPSDLRGVIWAEKTCD